MPSAVLPGKDDPVHCNWQGKRLKILMQQTYLVLYKNASIVAVGVIIIYIVSCANYMLHYCFNHNA